ncbi:hypothetical protein [Streptomyces sp. NPDC058252]|uniref:hypothetical protein n=1 Tax=Streptomyces sp. NPDC058252 TaxID=3346405 RepID=UPI0036E02358
MTADSRRRWATARSVLCRWKPPKSPDRAVTATMTTASRTAPTDADMAAPAPRTGVSGFAISAR